MLGLAGDPVRQARPGCTSTKPACLQPGSRAAVCRTASYHKRHRAVSTSHQAAATAFSGAHGAGPYASATAAAAAPTAVQDLLAQVAQEESVSNRYPQHTVDVGQMQLHRQLQHHDQVLLQQQLEHLHQQHQPRQRQQQQQQQQDTHPPSEQQQQQQHEEQQEQQDLHQDGLPPAPNAHLQQHAANGQESLQHSWHEGSRAHAVLQAPAEFASAVGQPPPHNRASIATHTGRSSSSSPGSVAQLAAAAQAAWEVGPAVPAHSQQQAQMELLQGQPAQQQAQTAAQHRLLGRTPAGLPLVRLHRGCKPAQVAAVLCSCLLQEQQVVLSAAGADLALLALNCLERAVSLQQQQQPGSLLLAVPHVRSSRRPAGPGRVQVFDLVCSVQPGVLEQPQQQQRHQQHRQQRQHPTTVQAVQPAFPQPHRQQQQQGAGGGAPALETVHHSPCCSGSMLAGGEGLQQAADHSAAVHSGSSGCCHELPQQQHWQGVQHSNNVAPARQLLLQYAGNGNGSGQHRHGSPLRHAHPLQDPAQFVPSPAQRQGPATPQGRWQVVQQQGQQQQHQDRAAGPRSTSSSMSSADAVYAPLAAAGATAPDYLQPPPAVGTATAGSQPGSMGAGAAGGVGAVAVVKVAGCSMNVADAVEDALDASAAGAVMLPVAHAKQAVRVLEAASLLTSRFTQRQQRQAWQAWLAEPEPGLGSSSSSGALDAALQLVLQPRRGKVRGQSGSSSRGLHVFLYGALHVH